jgi:hypothetical protein
MGQPGTYAVTLLLTGILALVGGIGLAALANEKRVADEQAAAASKSADS